MADAMMVDRARGDTAIDMPASASGNVHGSLDDYVVRSQPAIHSCMVSQSSLPTRCTTCAIGEQVQNLIGRGKYSTVFAARHQPTQTTVALKKVRTHQHLQQRCHNACGIACSQ